MSNPCKEKKCISYPICISKSVIGCEILNDYISDFRAHYGRSHDSYSSGFNAHLWRNINSFLPNLEMTKTKKQAKHK